MPIAIIAFEDCPLHGSTPSSRVFVDLGYRTVYASSMPHGSTHSPTGKLVATGRGYALDPDDGQRCRLDILDTIAAAWIVGQRVTATGTRSGSDLLDVETLALAD